MARLPVPGSDSNAWGTILNEFLTQAHNTNGTLKDGSVGTGAIQDAAITASKITTTNTPTTGQFLSHSNAGLTWASATTDPTLGGDLSGTASNAQIADGAVGTTQLVTSAVTTDKIADGSITPAKLAATSSSQSTGLRSLLIFYAPPNIMNGRYSDDYAAGVLARYGDVILPAGLQNPNDTYHASTKTIIQKVTALGVDTVCWGYIDLGVTSSNLSISTLQSQVDEWVAMGVKGIFCDLVGYDYGVSRARQNTMLQYIHSKNLPAMLNVWNIDDLLGSSVDTTYNPTGTPTAATSADALLLESWICNTDANPSPYFSTFGNIKTRGDKAVSYRSSMGIRIYATNIFSYSNHSLPQIKEMYDYTNAFARIWRLDGSGLGASNYSSAGVDLGVARPLYSQLRDTPLRKNAPYSLNSPWTQIDATDIGVTVMFDPGTSTYSWSQD